MATIAQTKVNGLTTSTVVSVTTLTASDTITYTAGAKQLLVLQNATGSDVTITIDGSGATTISPSGYGGTIDISAGKEITVVDGETLSLGLDTISAFLKGTITVTGGTGVTAMLLV